jgi:hypothetical protein
MDMKAVKVVIQAVKVVIRACNIDCDLGQGIEKLERGQGMEFVSSIMFLLLL